MSMTVRAVDTIRPITRSESQGLAATENERVLALLRSLSDGDWSKPTDCPAWDVRALAGHILGGMEGFCSYGRLIHMMRSAKQEAGKGSFIDGMTTVQVRERVDLSHDELLQRLAEAGPKSARFRSRIPGPFRVMPMKQVLLSGNTETWKMGYLVDTILTRDTWMHRVDIARATGREFVQAAEHDGRIVADAVAEWARRHGKPFILQLAGVAGGTFVGGAGGESISMDSVEFCRTLSGRATATGLLAQEVPF